MLILFSPNALMFSENAWPCIVCDSVCSLTGKEKRLSRTSCLLGSRLVEEGK